jgi:hypothetical protein
MPEPIHEPEDREPPAAPRDAYRRARWIPAWRIDWAREYDRILVDEGEVWGSQTYEYHYQARWRAQYLMKTLVELGMHERWELGEHIEPRDDGYGWAVELRKDGHYGDTRRRLRTSGSRESPASRRGGR